MESGAMEVGVGRLHPLNNKADNRMADVNNLLFIRYSSFSVYKKRMPVIPIGNMNNPLIKRDYQNLSGPMQ
jgi:hypothetical protein